MRSNRDDAMTMDIHTTVSIMRLYIKNVNEAIVAENLPTSEQEFSITHQSFVSQSSQQRGGAWNHNFFWQVMKPGADGTPYGKVVAAPWRVVRFRAQVHGAI